MEIVKANNTLLVNRKDYTAKYKVERFLAYFVLFFTFIMFNAEYLSPVLSAVKYLNDLCIVALFVLCLNRIIPTFKKLNALPVLYAIAIFILVCVVTSIINGVKITLFVWGFRNTFRGLAFLISVVCVFDNIDISKIFKAFFYIQILNFVLVVIQVINGARGDAVKGLFGSLNVNALGLFSAILISYFFVAYVKRKEGYLKFALTTLISFVTVAVSENKMGFVFVLVCLILALVFRGDGKRKVYLTLTVLAFGALGMALLYIIEPYAFSQLASISNMFKYLATTYEEGYKIPRLGGITWIINNFFGGNAVKTLFGMGLGNCDTSQFSIFQSEFYSVYGSYNYRWFTHQWIFVECGILGLISYTAIFASGLVCMLTGAFKKSAKGYYLIPVGITMVTYLIFSIFITPCLKTDMAYLSFFGFAVGLVALKPKAVVKKEEGQEE